MPIVMRKIFFTNFMCFLLVVVSSCDQEAIHPCFDELDAGSELLSNESDPVISRHVALKIATTIRYLEGRVNKVDQFEIALIKAQFSAHMNGNALVPIIALENQSEIDRVVESNLRGELVSYEVSLLDFIAEVVDRLRQKRGMTFETLRAFRSQDLFSEEYAKYFRSPSMTGTSMKADP